MKSITEGIVASYDSRMKEMKDLTDDARKTVRDFASARRHMGAGQAKALADGETARMKSFKDMMADIREVIKGVEKSVQDIKAHVAGMLEEFSGARAEMRRELRKDLADYAANIVKETKAVLAGFARERATMSADWQGMAAAMAKKRGAKAPAEAKPGIAPIAPTQEAEPKRKARGKRSRKSA